MFLMRRRPEVLGGLVYSTEHGTMCPVCGKPLARCECRHSRLTPAGDGVVRVGRETKGRKGSGVTVITGVPLGPADLADLCTQLKKRCGSGGTVKDGVIEIQGDHRDAVVAELAARGWTVKRAGG
jgi:translation initiation factor 1